MPFLPPRRRRDRLDFRRRPGARTGPQVFDWIQLRRLGRSVFITIGSIAEVRETAHDERGQTVVGEKSPSREQPTISALQMVQRTISGRGKQIIFELVRVLPEGAERSGGSG